jgi:hypothetical protein
MWFTDVVQRMYRRLSSNWKFFSAIAAQAQSITLIPGCLICCTT